MNLRTTISAVLLLSTISLLFGNANAGNYTATPDMSNSVINALIRSMVPGDTLYIETGTYNGIDLVIQKTDSPSSGLVGTADQPISIIGVGDGDSRPTLVANTDAFQENILLTSGSAYITIKNLHLRHSGSDKQHGILFEDNVHDIVIDNCEIEHITGIGITMQLRNNVHHVTIKNCLIYDTGLNPATSNGGQGFTAGAFDLGSAVTGVHDLILQGNVVHDTTGQEGDCMKFMYGVYRSQMLDNVMWNCPRGVAQNENYGIAIYGGPAHIDSASDVNIAARNLILDTAQTSPLNNVALYIGAGTIAENNLIVNANQGIAVRLEGASSWKNTRVVHNTVYQTTDSAFSINHLDSGLDNTLVIANNIFSVGSSTSGYGYRWVPEDTVGGTVWANYFDGLDYGSSLNSTSQMIRLTGASSSYFVNPSASVPADFMVQGYLVDAGNSANSVPEDFDNNDRPEGAAPDVGCYESGSSGDHWAINKGFKSSLGPVSGGDGSDGDGMAATISVPGYLGFVASLVQ